MKHKVAELEGVLLDAAVAKAEGINFTYGPVEGKPESWDVDAIWVLGAMGAEQYSPSTDGRAGIDIIERERITIDAQAAIVRGESRRWWRAWLHPMRSAFHQNGSTALIAAMRAYCASRFGDEVELP